MRQAALGIAVIGLLAGCSTWSESIPRPPERTLEDKVEARRKADDKTRKCVLEQTLRRQQKEQGRDVRPLPKEKC